jgi:hypothetical protein
LLPNLVLVKIEIIGHGHLEHILTKPSFVRVQWSVANDHADEGEATEAVPVVVEWGVSVEDEDRLGRVGCVVQLHDSSVLATKTVIMAARLRNNINRPGLGRFINRLVAADPEPRIFRGFL